MVEKQLSLYTAWYCPYAQRSWAFIEHLGLPFERIDIDPYQKTPEWLKISRGHGTVPVVQTHSPDHAPFSVPGSLETMEYLADIKAAAERVPVDPDMRANQRYWLGHIDKHITPNYYRFLTKPRGSRDSDQAVEGLLNGLIDLIAGAPLDGWFAGPDAPGIIDFALAPFALRMRLLFPHFKDFTLPTHGNGWSEYRDWEKRIVSVSAFKRSAPDADTYEARLVEYYVSFIKSENQNETTRP